MKCGVVDVGSNTIRLSIYRCDDTGVQLLLNRKEMTGLAGYVKGGRLSELGQRAACRTLSAFRTLLTNFDISDMYIFATASLRNVTNTQEVVDAIRLSTGLIVEVLSGTEEAALSFQGAAMGDSHKSGLLADIGGGSTELVAYENGVITSGCSLPVGSLSLYTQFVEGLFPTKLERHRLRAFARTELAQAKTVGLQCRHLCGVGGTIRAVAKLCNDLGGLEPDNPSIPAESISSLYHNLKKGDQATLRQILRSTPDRVHTILPGLIILTTLLTAYGVETVSVSTSGVREGYLMARVLSLPS